MNTPDALAIRAALAAMRGRAREFVIHGMCECLGHPYANDIHFAWQPCPPEQRLAQAIEADLPALLAVAEAAAGLKHGLAPNGDPAAWLIRSGGLWLCVGCESSAEDAADFPHADDCLGMALDRALAALAEPQP